MKHNKFAVIGAKGEFVVIPDLAIYGSISRHFASSLSSLHPLLCPGLIHLALEAFESQHKVRDRNGSICIKGSRDFVELVNAGKHKDDSSIARRKCGRESICLEKTGKVQIRNGEFIFLHILFLSRGQSVSESRSCWKEYQRILEEYRKIMNDF